MSWSRRRRQLRTRLSGPQLAGLSLADPAIAENAAAGTAVSAILGHTAGSALALVDDAGGRFALSGAALVTGPVASDHEETPSLSITLRETLTGYANSPRDSVITVAVTNTFEALNLAALSLSASDFIIGTPSAGTIIGIAAGSFVSASGTPAGLVIDEETRTWTWSGIGTPGSTEITLIETLADSANSPRVSLVDVTVSETSAIYLIADNGDRLTDDTLNPMILEAA